MKDELHLFIIRDVFHLLLEKLLVEFRFGEAEDLLLLMVLISEFRLTIVLVFLQKQKTVGRTKLLLETVPVYRLADIFVASFEISFEEQLSMLDSVDLKVRLSKATELVDRHLQVNIKKPNDL